MGLNGANGSGKSVEGETDKRRRGTRGGLMQCGTCGEAVCLGGGGGGESLGLQCQETVYKRFFLFYTITERHFRDC